MHCYTTTRLLNALVLLRHLARPTRILTTKKSSLLLLLFQIQFPGVTRDTFLALLYYLYTGQRPLLVNVDCVELIELANRLCLPRLLALTERHLVDALTAAEKDGNDIIEDVIFTLTSVQVNQHEIIIAT